MRATAAEGRRRGAGPRARAGGGDAGSHRAPAGAPGERAQAEGALRSDFAPQDIALVFWGTDRVIELAGDLAPEIWRRQLASCSTASDARRRPRSTTRR
jgi:hypothetical protein